MNARCTGNTCAVLTNQTDAEAMKCTTAQVVKDNIDGCKLPFHSAGGFGVSFI